MGGEGGGEIRKTDNQFACRRSTQPPSVPCEREMRTGLNHRLNPRGSQGTLAPEGRGYSAATGDPSTSSSYFIRKVAKRFYFFPFFEVFSLLLGTVCTQLVSKDDSDYLTVRLTA